ncbi:hit family protein 1 [Gymnopilus junonius]|uniref:Hit family protein 1 n=1 Tax=Gymnopilus junonius TaxID=109634 RepID=A0A9P5NCU4_GYMJU|nr:hit family protein 1 [Gymnopilus junonius]
MIIFSNSVISYLAHTYRKSLASCLFCKIIKGEIPSYKLIETEKSFAFVDIMPLSKGHSLVIPKYHAEQIQELPDEYLADILPIAKKIALAQGASDYNILQNNGKLAHQVIPHVHFHVIPKPNEEEGLIIGWPAKQLDKDELPKIHEELKAKIDAASSSSL